MTTVDSADTRWFRRRTNVPDPRMRLVCLPHAGGAASFFHSWAGAFGDDIEVLATRYPGRQDRIADPCFDSMAPLADAVAGALLPFLDKPLALFGHSMGASLAYEVALRLENLYGCRPAGLYVSSRAAPHRLSPGDVHLRGDEAIVNEVRRLGGSDAEVLDNPDLRELVMPAIRSDFRIVGTYQASSPISVRCPIFGYVGDREPNLAPADMMAWSEVTTGGFQLRVMPGDHFYLVPQRDALIRDLTDHFRPADGTFLPVEEATTDIAAR